MALILVTPPSTEPVTLAEAKSQLHIVGSDDDTLITRLIKVARTSIEHYLNRSLITQTWEYFCNEWPDENFFPLERGPLQSITWVKYLTTAQAVVELEAAPDGYEIDPNSMPPGFFMQNNNIWPTLGLGRNLIDVKYVAGYGNSSTNVPEDIRHGILLFLAHLYGNRENVVVQPSISVIEVPKTFEWLLGPYRVYEGPYA